MRGRHWFRSKYKIASFLKPGRFFHLKLYVHPFKDILNASWATFGGETCGKMELNNILNMVYPPPDLNAVQKGMVAESELHYVNHQFQEFPSETDRKMFSDLPQEILEVLVLLPHDQAAVLTWNKLQLLRYNLHCHKEILRAPKSIYLWTISYGSKVIFWKWRQ